MRRNDIIQCSNQIYRVLDLRNNEIFIIDCIKRTVPVWVCSSLFRDGSLLSEQQLCECLSMPLPDIESLDMKSQAIINQRFSKMEK